MLGPTKKFKDLLQDLGDEVLGNPGQDHSIDLKKLSRGDYQTVSQPPILIIKCVGNTWETFPPSTRSSSFTLSIGLVQFD